jgi:hypothetical protein
MSSRFHPEVIVRNLHDRPDKEESSQNDQGEQQQVCISGTLGSKISCAYNCQRNHTGESDWRFSQVHSEFSHVYML